MFDPQPPPVVGVPADATSAPPGRWRPSTSPAGRGQGRRRAPSHAQRPWPDRARAGPRAVPPAPTTRCPTPSPTAATSSRDHCSRPRSPRRAGWRTRRRLSSAAAPAAGRRIVGKHGVRTSRSGGQRRSRAPGGRELGATATNPSAVSTTRSRSPTDPSTGSPRTTGRWSAAWTSTCSVPRRDRPRGGLSSPRVGAGLLLRPHRGCLRRATAPPSTGGRVSPGRRRPRWSRCGRGRTTGARRSPPPPRSGPRRPTRCRRAAVRRHPPSSTTPLP